ncbi:hypothetical protein K438DRAFT_2031250 [Mycena galopus ATCC 62051]|nr:hypothetical protein K438DRAFT_2031250 [Mycena galopus ATCC 62051]
MPLTYTLLLTFAVAAVTATFSTDQCCSSLIPASSPAVTPILAFLGITIPSSGDIGVCCKAINTSCASDCDGEAVSCSGVSPSVLGIDIGTGCTPLPPCGPPCNTIGTNNSQLYGASTGNAFNDLVTVGGNGSFTTDNAPSIQAITLRYGSVVDGLAVTYSQGAGQSPITISHGTSLIATGPTNTTVALSATESIISVSGQSGVHSPYGVRILQLSFLILDSSTGTTRVQGPFGTATGTAFNVTDGPLLALSGFAINTDTALSNLNGAPGGLYGLSFITSTGLNCTT